jgi:hypothetical protein
VWRRWTVHLRRRERGGQLRQNRIADAVSDHVVANYLSFWLANHFVADHHATLHLNTHHLTDWVPGHFVADRLSNRRAAATALFCGIT